jgi:hypothetical protein
VNTKWRIKTNSSELSLMHTRRGSYPYIAPLVPLPPLIGLAGALQRVNGGLLVGFLLTRRRLPFPRIKPRPRSASSRLIHALIHLTRSMAVVMSINLRDARAVVASDMEPGSRWNRMAIAALHATDASRCMAPDRKMFRRASALSALVLPARSQPHKPPLADVS